MSTGDIFGSISYVLINDEATLYPKLNFSEEI